MDPATLKVEQKPLFVPPLKQVAQVLQEGLKLYFKSVKVSVVDCPDLTQEPFCLTSQGLNGSTRVVEVGGVSNFMPLYNPKKVYDLKHLNHLLGVDPAAAIGTGLGPFLSPNHICTELLTNAVISHGHVTSMNRVAKVTDENERGYVSEMLPKDESKFMIMSNLFVSNGKPGKVLKIICKNRKSQKDFAAAIQQCLGDKFPDQPIGLGGVFTVDGSKVRQHIPPVQFSDVPITTQAQFNRWLRFYDMNPPLVFVGTIITQDMGMDMILQHFHSFSSHGEGGHYHFDVNPHTVKYQGYFNLAELAVHIDQPPLISHLNVDKIFIAQ